MLFFSNLYNCRICYESISINTTDLHFAPCLLQHTVCPGENIWESRANDTCGSGNTFFLYNLIGMVVQYVFRMI